MTTKININPTPPSEKQYVPIIMFNLVYAILMLLSLIDKGLTVNPHNVTLPLFTWLLNPIELFVIVGAH